MCVYTCVRCGVQFVVIDAPECEDSDGICRKCLEEMRKERQTKKKITLSKQDYNPLEDV